MYALTHTQQYTHRLTSECVCARAHTHIMQNVQVIHAELHAKMLKLKCKMLKQ